MDKTVEMNCRRLRQAAHAAERAYLVAELASAHHALTLVKLELRVLDAREALDSARAEETDAMDADASAPDIKGWEKRSSRIRQARLATAASEVAYNRLIDDPRRHTRLPYNPELLAEHHRTRQESDKAISEMWRGRCDGLGRSA